MLGKLALLTFILTYGCNPPTSVQFSDVTEALGLDALVSAYGLSLGDWNGDQCLDLFVGSHDKPSHLFENDCKGKFTDRIEQFGTEVSYRLYNEGGPRQNRVFLAPALTVGNEFHLNQETFLFYRPPRSRTSRPGYYIWRDLKTMAWHVRWVGERAKFDGVISWGVPAHVTTVGFQDVDRIRASAAHSLDFSSAIVAEEEKGVDIRISPFLRSDVTITFDLRINGEYAREDISIGAIGAHPWIDRFSLGAFSSLWIKPSYRPGSDVGYFLWRTPEDGVWHLRWSNNEQDRLFHGTIKTQNGKFSIVGNSPGLSKLLDLGKTSINFKSKMNSGEAGFDFTADSWKGQGLIELTIYIDEAPTTVRTGAWSHFNGLESSFSYERSFSKQPFLFPSQIPAGFVVTPDFIGWPGDGGSVHMYRGEIETSRQINKATFEPNLANSIVKIKPNRLSFAVPSSRDWQILRFEHDGLKVFGDRHAAVWGDLDNNGDTDLYVSNGGARGKGNILGGELWENKKGIDFRGVGIQKGVNDPEGRGRGVSLVDFDNDGYLDIYKTNVERPCRLFHNRRGSFKDVAEQFGVAGPFGVYNPISASWADFDKDGFMDLLLVANPVRLFRNVNGTFFKDVTKQAGLENQYMVHSASWGDYDNDGNLDLYLSKAYGITQFKSSVNVLLRNNGNGTFTDRTAQSGVGSSKNSRDATWFDFDNDGDLDLYVVNSTSILSFAPWFFPPLLDWWLWLLERNVFDHANILYENLGDGTFRNVTRQAGVGSSGANSGVAAGDFNGDGFVDLFLSTGYYPLETGKLKVYENLANGNHWLTLHLVGRQSNRSAIGAKVSLYTGARVQFRELNGGVHAFSQDGPMVHFGLGNSKMIDRIEIAWPSGKRTRLENLQVDQLLRIVE